MSVSGIGDRQGRDFGIFISEIFATPWFLVRLNLVSSVKFSHVKTDQLLSEAN
jgi:hypothetical protein